MEIQENQEETRSETESYKDEDDFVEITLDLRDDTVPVQNIRGGDSKTALLASRLELKFMIKNIGTEGWSQVEKLFDELAVDGKLPRSCFSRCIGMHESREFAGELFDALSRRWGITSASITKDELCEFWEQITDRSFHSRLQTFFDMVDKNADGRITKEEVTELRNLEMLRLQGPAKPTRFTTEYWHAREDNPIESGFWALAYFIEENWKRIWVIALWLFICAALFTWKFIQYKNRAVFHIMGYCVTTAKGAAETLKFNMALILLPVCRNTITWLRSKTKLGVAVPFHDNLNFHKVIAFGIAIGVGMHAISHLTCDFPRLLHATDEEYVPMKPFFGVERPNNYWWFVKGTEDWTGITMVVLMAIAYTLALPWFRRDKLNLPKFLKKLTGFNAFWYSHHLFVIVYALFIVHGHYLYLSKEWYKKTTWMYLCIPMILYACERLLRAFRSGNKSVKILKVIVYPGNVLALHMSKPQGFKYSSGQYIFVNCSDVSPFQWHPFYITSAPGDDYLSVHIRTLGDWTAQLKAVFSEACQPASGDQSGLLRADMLQGNNIPRMPKLLIDGPYGAPAQDYKNYEVILLLGVGIGATPLISILKDILNNIKQQKHIEEGVVEGGVKNNKKKPFATNKAYFHCVIREQGSFEWFKGVIDEVAENDKNGIIELHNYCLSVYEEGDARSALITILQSLHHAKNGVDIVSGTRVKTHFARPNWRSVFKHAALQHPGKRVGVFYNGAPGWIGW